jgi:transcriptional regulator with XRE-family HTH domain
MRKYQRLRDLREDLDINQTEFAKILGMSQTGYSKYETGENDIPVEILEKLADIYHTSTDYLLGRTMSREGAAVSAEDLPDSSARKDNVLKGSAMAMLAKKLQVNGTAALYGALGADGTKDAILASSAYMSLAFYKVYRTLYNSDPAHSPEAFSLSENGWRELCDAAMKQQEHKLRRLSTPIAGLTNEEMQQASPQLAPSLFTLLHNASELMEKLDRE